MRIIKEEELAKSSFYGELFYCYVYRIEYKIKLIIFVSFALYFTVNKA